MRALSLLPLFLALGGCLTDLTSGVEGGSSESCLDGLDNDGDGAIDCEDEACLIFTFCDPRDDDDTAPDDDDTAPDDDDTAPDDDDTAPDDDDTGPDDDDSAPDDDDSAPDDDDSAPDDDDATADDDDVAPDDDDVAPDDDDATADDDDAIPDDDDATADDDDSAAPTRDDDGDGYSEQDGDCDNQDPAVHPGAPEVCDGVDSDCDPYAPVGVEARLEQLGGPTYVSGPLNGLFGASLLPYEEATLTGLDWYLDAAAGDTLRWTLYWALGNNGPWTAVHSHTTVAAASGPMWHSSGPMSQPLQPGRRYLYAVTTTLPAEGRWSYDNSWMPWANHQGRFAISGGLASGAQASNTSGAPWVRLSVELEATEQDNDGDGVPDCEDCDDRAPERFPGNPEICDGLDNDCDQALAAGEDVDEDEDGSPACLDCDDDDPTRAPYQGESCDGVDNDCDGVVPPGEIDGDGDGFLACFDCDDGDPAVHPGAPEACDGVDTNCNGIVWPGEFDVDGDGITECEGDCDALDPSIHPGAPEVCDAADSDCDGVTPLDEIDGDGDGFADCNGECDDADPTVHPAAAELCNAIDDDCDGSVPPDEVDTDGDGDLDCFDCEASPLAGQDADNDGFDACQDCDDYDPQRFPGNAETCDGLDNDCDPLTGDQGDADGDGLTICDGDCDDQDPGVGPALPGNLPPAADAGPDLAAGGSVSCGVDAYGNAWCDSYCPQVAIALDGTGTVDPDGDDIAWSWTVEDDGGSYLWIEGAGTATPTLHIEPAAPSAANTVRSAAAIVRLTASDCGGSADDTVVITTTCSSLP
jgi:hypothetical protein